MENHPNDLCSNSRTKIKVEMGWSFSAIYTPEVDRASNVGRPASQKSRGRPLTHGEVDFKRTVGPGWREVVHGRDTWGSLEETFIQTGVLAD